MNARDRNWKGDYLEKKMKGDSLGAVGWGRNPPGEGILQGKEPALGPRGAPSTAQAQGHPEGPGGGGGALCVSHHTVALLAGSSGPPKATQSTVPSAPCSGLDPCC